MNKLRLLVIFAFFVLGSMFLCSCGQASDEKTEYSDNEVGDSMLTLYYVNSDWTYLIPYATTVDSFASPEIIIDTIVTNLLDGQGDMTGVAPKGMAYQRYAYDGKGTVSIIWSVDQEAATSYDVVLSKASFVKTLCQLDFVNVVVFEMADMVNDENVVREELTLESFADMNNLMSSQMEVDIYFPDSTGERLEIRKVTLDCSAKEPVYEQILSILKDGYDGCVSPLNIDTRIENVWLDNTTCYVKFNKNFAKGKNGVEDNILVYSIVNSLVGLDHIDHVKISIDDKKGTNSLGDIDLSKKLVGDYSYVNR
ncbi:MAG: GerMN domain-containing protein [Coprococcus sp.]|nr:GerMN domain-containing protein [Coprococcus sp.]